MLKIQALTVNISILNQYNAECRRALACNAKIGKCFEKVLMDTMQLYMCIPDRINFLQLGRYGKFSEQTYRNNFERNDFDWLSFNASLAERILSGRRRAIAIDPSFISKSGHKTPWIGYFWSGTAATTKRGLEILGLGLVDADDKDCVSLVAVQTPDTVTLDNISSNLVDWYAAVLKSKKEQLQKLTRNVVADAFFSKETFITPLLKEGFHVISRFRNDSVLFYPTSKERTGKRGRPQLYDGKIDFADLDVSRCEKLEADRGRLYSLKAYSKPLRRMVRLVVWYPDDNSARWNLYFTTDVGMSGKDILDIYRTRFLIEFCFRDGKHHTGLAQCQSTSVNKLAFNFNASLSSINLAKAASKSLRIPFSISSCKTVIHNAYMLERFICVSGLDPDPHLIDKLIKELVLFTSRAA